jgi:hypothetical protein
MTKTAFRLPQYQNPNFGSTGANDFNDLQNRKSRGIPQRIRPLGRASKRPSIILIGTFPVCAGERQSTSI